MKASPVNSKIAMLIIAIILLVIVFLAWQVQCALSAEANIPKKCFEPQARNSELPRYKVCKKFNIEWKFLPLIMNNKEGGVLIPPVCLPPEDC